MLYTVIPIGIKEIGFNMITTNDLKGLSYGQALQYCVFDHDRNASNWNPHIEPYAHIIADVYNVTDNRAYNDILAVRRGMHNAYYDGMYIELDKQTHIVSMW